MIRFTTPTIPLTVDKDLTGADIYVTFSQGGVKLTKQNPEYTIEDSKTSLSVPLTQEETAKFTGSETKVNIQVNWIYPSGKRGATDIQSVKSLTNLLNEVIEYEG